LNTIFYIQSNKPLSGIINLPASKSITNRALILNYLAKDSFTISNQSLAEDSILLEELLKKINRLSENQLINEIYVNNAGTAMRFLTTLLSITKGNWILNGSDRMKERPIAELVKALKLLGADISYIEKKGFPPLFIKGKKLKSLQLIIDAQTSSQFITSLLLVSAFLNDGLSLEFKGKIVSKPYINMTLKVLEYFGIEHTYIENCIKIKKQELKPETIFIESDWSAASYWYEIVAFSKNIELKLIGLTKSGWQGDAIVAEIFNQFGVKTEYLSDGIRLTNTNKIVQFFTFDFTDYPDIAQTIAVCCAGLGIKAELKGLRSLKIKECDRLIALETELNKIGCKAVVINNNTLQIPASKITTEKIIHTYNDHRMAMSFAPLAIINGAIPIDNIDVVKKSYPDFWKDLQKSGFSIE